QAEGGIGGFHVTGVQTCGLPISVNIVEGGGNGYVVDGGGKVTLGSENKGNVDGMRIGQPDQREELIAEILQYLQHTIIAWQDDKDRKSVVQERVVEGWCGRDTTQ